MGLFPAPAASIVWQSQATQTPKSQIKTSWPHPIATTPLWNGTKTSTNPIVKRKLNCHCLYVLHILLVCYADLTLTIANTYCSVRHTIMPESNHQVPKDSLHTTTKLSTGIMFPLSLALSTHTVILAKRVGQRPNWSTLSYSYNWLTTRAHPFSMHSFWTHELGKSALPSSGTSSRWKIGSNIGTTFAGVKNKCRR